jgi:hypothetical protein
MNRRVLIPTCAAAVAAALALAVPAAAAPSWAPAAGAAIHPGVQTHTAGGQCTANFVFYDSSTFPFQDPSVYIGQAAHCAGTGSGTDTNGCTTGTLPVGTRVDIAGASKPGTLVYSSWVTMKERGEANGDTCRFNDFALVKVDPADVGKVNPSIPFWGGPTGLNTTGTRLGDKVVTYGNSQLRFGIEQLRPKQGKSLGAAGGGWSHTVFTVTPGIPGDSGSAFLDASGRAVGVLSTLSFVPLPGTNGVGDLGRELSYMKANTSFDVTLANGTEPFRGPVV